MNSIVTQEYEDYQQAIEGRIHVLHAEKGMLDFASGIVCWQEVKMLLMKWQQN